MASPGRSPSLDSTRPKSGRFMSRILREMLRQRAGEIAALVLAVIAAILLVALLSYDPRDPSFNTATARPVSNLAGSAGAMLADILLQGFGLVGLLPCVVLFAWVWRLASHRGIGVLGARILSLVLAMPMAAALLAGLPLAGRLTWPTIAGPGGAIGNVLAGGLTHFSFSVLGAFGVTLGLLTTGALSLLLGWLAMGLRAGEWRAMGRGTAQAARASASGGRQAIGFLGRAGHGLRLFGRMLICPLTFWRRTGAPTRQGLVLEETPAGPMVMWDAPAAGMAGSAADEPAPSRPKPTTARRIVPKQESLALDGWQFPPLSLLRPPPARGASGPSRETLDNNSRLLETVLSDYGVEGRIVDQKAGPVVTLYELEPAPGIRSSRVIGLADDIARSLSVASVRIATVSGRNVIGIEVPNAKRETVYLSELLASPSVRQHPGKLAMALGKDIEGTPVIADLATMPHLMIAGTTGSGKSVGVNAMILSLLYRLSPDQCRLIMIDPKMLELSVYEGIPHLMAPVVTEPAKAVTALKWTVREMERRYRAMTHLGVRNLAGYNIRIEDARAKGETLSRRVQTGFDPDTNKPVHEEQPLALESLPLIVVVVDEMADLMMVAGKEIEAAIQRLAQMARAAGIHVIMATQRPSVDVITGVIKANFPTRISFQVISKFDSRTILGEQGAEQLLGQGDMLFMSAGGRVRRVHGPFVSDQEVEEVVNFLRAQGEPSYLEEVTEAEDDDGTSPLPSFSDGAGENGLYSQAVALVTREGKASTSFLQRHLNIGYNRAAKLIEQMEKEGVVGTADHVGRREVLGRGD
ncbi:MAG: DNA translocase FtsK [Acetobacteraceae bacterium]|nr:DNA translocase FtsK [Acetobacteraceae bacterium]